MNGKFVTSSLRPTCISISIFIKKCMRSSEEGTDKTKQPKVLISKNATQKKSSPPKSQPNKNSKLEACYTSIRPKMRLVAQPTCITPQT